jgi:hypothetical protein
MSRCNDKTHPRYGGRGIRVCARWRDFENFLADMGEAPPGMYLDRIDNDGDYEPGNCRWATAKQSIDNRSTTRFITHDGLTLCVRDWERKLGMKQCTLWRRLKMGWSEHRALTEPVR